MQLPYLERRRGRVASNGPYVRSGNQPRREQRALQGDTWAALLNPKTGFKVVNVAMGEPARIHPDYSHDNLGRIHKATCYLASAVLCRKIAGTQLAWDMELEDIASLPYPF
jgi:hypothetical protein